MDLWVRSQDKTRIIKCEDITIIPVVYNYGTKKEIDSYKIVELNYQDRDCEYLGVYKTKERALEVFDAIQDLLQNAYVGNSNRLVYEMPKE